MKSEAVKNWTSICLLLFIVFDVANSRLLSNNGTRRIRRQSCGTYDFKCASGECIDVDKECDGLDDCADGSDETTECARIRCPGFAFTCKYGACINGNKKCDTHKDCKDNSDEDPVLCGHEKLNKPSKCTDSQFQCLSGECIHEDSKCDGVADCKDQSDETAATCSSIRCPGFTYKCRYGACVNGNSRCNSIRECLDGSDEDPAICGPPSTTPKPPTPVVTPSTGPPPTPLPETPEGTCALPKHPRFGQWKVHGIEGSYAPGGIVSANTILTFSCNKRYKLGGKSYIFCTFNGWSDPIATCELLCSPIKASATMEVSCKLGGEKSNCSEPVTGTVVAFKCAPFYENLELQKNPYRICREGTWDNTLPQCSPVCGKKSVSAQTLIVNGTVVPKGDYPWQVALYKSKNTAHTLICGGSLINQRVLVTAAHCITDGKGKLLSKTQYSVAAGKYYRDYSDTRDEEAEFSKVKDMFVPVQYRGEIQNYLGDIAVMITEKDFTLSNRIQPVCVDWGTNYNQQLLNPDNKGFVAGWGFTQENAQPSEVLKELEVPYVLFDECTQQIPEDFQAYLTHDKICSGYINKSIGVCKGDSGGGLVFKNRYDGRYYLTGIVSLSPFSPTSGGCNTQQYGLYTRVSNYVQEFLYEKYAPFNVA